MQDNEKKRGEDRAKMIKTYHEVFNTPGGSAVLLDLMDKHGVLNAHPVDPHMMAIKEGERGVILRILATLQTNPVELLKRINYEADQPE